MGDEKGGCQTLHRQIKLKYQTPDIDWHNKKNNLLLIPCVVFIFKRLWRMQMYFALQKMCLFCQCMCAKKRPLSTQQNPDNKAQTGTTSILDSRSSYTNITKIEVSLALIIQHLHFTKQKLQTVIHLLAQHLPCHLTFILT